ncbi:MAG: hypothetical protein JSS20_11120 [Proteobacteria bacterium]|nr:hypothetical protein [Pseudomonadota bacterium]
MTDNFRWSFEAGKYRAHDAYDSLVSGLGQMVTDVEGTRDKFTGTYTDPRGKITHFSSDDLGKKTDAGESAEAGRSLIQRAEAKKITEEYNGISKKLDENMERKRFERAPGLEI